MASSPYQKEAMTMRRFRVRPVLAGALLLTAVANLRGAQNEDGGPPGERRAAYAIGLWGDLPYSTEQANPGVPHLIADMNAQKLAFTVHDGDLKSGSSCNNLCDIAPNPAEFSARNAANIVWLQETFAHARASGSAAIMLIAQANPGWDQSDPTRAPLRDPRTLAETDGQADGFKDYLSALRTEVVAFRKPVAYVHGDSHYFRVDKPFQDALGRRLENFTRVETFGDNQQNGTNDVHWLKVTVDVKSREVFSYEPQMVPANRVAVPQP